MSNQAKHTPGPWPFTHVYGAIRHICRNCDHDTYCFDASQGTCQFAWSYNDAYLISAAPDLLEALRVLVDHAKEQYPHFESERGQRDITAALQAIAKAEGRHE